MTPVSDIGKVLHVLGRCRIAVKLMTGDAQIDKKDPNVFISHFQKLCEIAQN